MAKNISIKTITEPAQQIKVWRECDVVVVGAGPGGHAAAIAAARNGADTILVERYGHLGGMASGGVVTIIPNLTDRFGKQQIAGQTQEWVDRLDKREATDYPSRELWGNKDKAKVQEWFRRSFFYTRLDMVIYSVLFDAEILKCVLNDMAEEAKVKVLMHSWGVKSIMDKNEVQGIIFESKAGRTPSSPKLSLTAPVTAICCLPPAPGSIRTWTSPCASPTSRFATGWAASTSRKPSISATASRRNTRR